MANNPSLPASPKQYTLDLGIEVEKSVGGVEMGVLENGMPYLTQTGLATNRLRWYEILAIAAAVMACLVTVVGSGVRVLQSLT
jgi:hypothetical protein